MGTATMHVSCVLLCLFGRAMAAQSLQSTPGSDAEAVLLQQLKNRFADFQTTTKETIKTLSRQLMLQQLHAEERIRSDGGSGLKQSRTASSGTRPYFTSTFTSGGVASGHDHANYDRTVGLGEFIAVLNGVEFRTRHNDYKIKMPSTKSKNWNELEDVPFPPIPPSVLQKHNVREEIDEMREYFRAFNEQNTTIRDWVPYFKPVMCYLEGGWTTNTKTLEEPFHSDRHLIDASSWLDLQEKIRYTSFSGSKNNLENFAYLPTTIVNVTEDGIPVFAQWNYRIACHPIKTYLDLNYFSLVDDLAVRMGYSKTITALPLTRSARFAITPSPGHSYNKETGHAEGTEKPYIYGKLDEIMSEIPGKENYPGYLNGKDYGYTKYRIDASNNTVMNTAFYHRNHKVSDPSTEAVSLREEGFSDRNLWIAETSSQHIVDMGIRDCHQENTKSVCERHEGRFTYSIPFEVIWLTPLSTWNPYNVKVHDWSHRNKVRAGGRNGGTSADKAFNGSSVDNYYLTPSGFFHGGEVNSDPADTAKNYAGVLDQRGQVRYLSASGVRFFLPDIIGVGKIRTRYPIMPVHQEGNVIWKNLQALQDITMDMKTNTKMFEQRPDIINPPVHLPDIHYITTDSRKFPPGVHHHDVYISAGDKLILENNGTIWTNTTESEGHHHELELIQDPKMYWALGLLSCDGRKVCTDWHGIRVFQKP